MLRLDETRDVISMSQKCHYSYFCELFDLKPFREINQMFLFDFVHVWNAVILQRLTKKYMKLTHVYR